MKRHVQHALAGLFTILMGVLFIGQGVFAVMTGSFEVETSARSGTANLVTDASASADTAVQFTNTTSPPPPPSTPSDFCSSFPAQPSSKPDATNTGVPAGTTLTASGDITVTTSNTIIENKDITGSITVNSGVNNVTIRNSKIHTSGGSAYIAVNIKGGTGHKILNSELYTTNGGYIGITTGDTTVCGTYIHGFENGMTVSGGMMIQANFIEKLAGQQSSPHYDGIEIYSGSNSTLIGNNIRMTSPTGTWLGDTGAINLTTEWSSIANVEMRGNWIGGGGYTLYIRRSSTNPGYNYSNIQVLNNRWYGSAPKGYAQWGPISDDGGSITFTGNVWDTTNSPI